MKTYILFPNNLELKAHSLLSSEDNFLKTSNDISLNELSFIESKDNLFYFMERIKMARFFQELIMEFNENIYIIS